VHHGEQTRDTGVIPLTKVWGCIAHAVASRYAEFNSPVRSYAPAISRLVSNSEPRDFGTIGYDDGVCPPDD
jgi:hypothetical protein